MRKAFLSLLLFIQAFIMSGQTHVAYENMVGTEELYQTLDYLASELAEGRATGTPGKLSAEQFIKERFRKYGLKPFEWNYTQSFPYDDSIMVRNVIGVVPANRMSDEYIVIGAHYDHLGRLGGRRRQRLRRHGPAEPGAAFRQDEGRRGWPGQEPDLHRV